MNPLPPNADELVSAYLDGQAAPDEITTVESSSELMERVAALRSVSDLLGAPVAAPTEQKEAHISAALDAFYALFSADTADTTKSSASPLVAAPPILAETPAPSEQPTGVTSLSQARERRRPRRFNVGVIAAAAALLLFVAVAAFGFGGGDSLDVATSSADSAVATDAGSDAADDAMDDEEAMEEEAAEAIEAEEAMDEEAVEIDEAADSDTSGAADLRASEPFVFSALSFPDQESLLLELDGLPLEDLERRALLIEPGLFPGCQQDVVDLAKIESPTLIGQTLIEDQLVEIHQTLDADGAIMFVILDAADCTVLPATP